MKNTAITSPRDDGRSDHGIRPVPLAVFRDEVLGGIRAEEIHRPVFITTRKAFRLLEAVGVRSTADLTPHAIERFVGSIEGADRTRRNYQCLVKRICAAAVEKGYLAVSPFTACPERGRFSRTPVPALTRARIRSPVQLRAVLDHLAERAEADPADHRVYALVAFMAYTGVCAADAVRLRVADVDFGAGTVRVPHRGKRKTPTPHVIPLHPDLAGVLAGWVEKRTRPESNLCKVDRAAVADIRRLAGEGVPARELAERFGISPSNVHAIARGDSWKPEVADQVGKSEWLFPSFRPGARGPWTRFDSVSGRIKAAGRAAEVEDLRLPDLLYIHRYLVVPAVIVLRPDQAAPVACVSPVLLGGPRTPPLALGKEMSILTAAEFAIVRALLDVFPNGLSWPELDRRSGYDFSRTTVKRLKAKDPLWDQVIKLPRETPHGDCRIVHP
jgi:integrase